MSRFNLLAVRTGEEPESPLFPEPGELPDSVEPDPDDGIRPLSFQTSELNLRELGPGQQSKRISRIKDIKAQVIVTDCRIAVACSKYEKGGGLTPLSLGAVPVAIGVNAVRKIRASRRRRGKMLVGHIRYPRLLSVGFTDKTGIAYPARLRIATLDPTVSGFRGLLLDVNLPKGQSGRELCERIARLAAAYNLSHGEDLGDELRTHLEQFRDPPRLSPVPKQFVSYVFVHTDNPGAAAALTAHS